MFDRILLGILFVMAGIVALTMLIIWLAPFLAIGAILYLIWKLAVKPALISDPIEGEVEVAPPPQDLDPAGSQPPELLSITRVDHPPR
jgi:hypothetical protein